MAGHEVINQDALKKLNQDPTWARDYYRSQTRENTRALVEAAVKANQGSIGQTTDAIMAIVEDFFLYPLIEVTVENNLNLSDPE